MSTARELEQFRAVRRALEREPSGFQSTLVRGRAQGEPQEASALHEHFCVLFLQRRVREALDELGLAEQERAFVLEGRLFELEVPSALEEWSAAFTPTRDKSSGRSSSSAEEHRYQLAHELGLLLDAFHAERAQQEGTTGQRKTLGSYFTPPELARRVVAPCRAFLEARLSAGTPVAVLDPAVGGGAFLLEAARLLEELRQQRGLESEVYRLTGSDLSPLALGVTDVALRLALGPKAGAPTLLLGDALLGEVLASRSYDWIVSNPPWVAFQGRSASPLSPDRRAAYRERFRSFQGYPTLHGMFVERASELCPQGLVTLLVPSSLADLDGYTRSREALTRTHQPLEPLEEFGADAFVGVVQPCFGLVAEPNPHAQPSPRAWRLLERAQKNGHARALEVPEVLEQLFTLPPLPESTFREAGFQSNRVVTERLFRRTAERPLEGEWTPLLEGRVVQEFVLGAPKLYLRSDRASLEGARVRLRPPNIYQQIDFVVRQTASYPIAACHDGTAFRNSLLAGFASPGLSREFLVGLLNSALFRALFVAKTRDARQAVFPQVKIGMLRRLPAPPPRTSRGLVAEVEAVTVEWSTQGQASAPRLSGGRRGDPALGTSCAELRERLDALVFEIFGLTRPERALVSRFLEQRAPGALGKRQSRS